MAGNGSTLATMSANSDCRSSSGEIREDGSRYLVVVDGEPREASRRFTEAAHTLARLIADRLRGGSRDWGVRATCSRGNFAVAFGNLAGGGGAPVDNQCLRRVLPPSPPDNVHAALERVARVIGECCK